MQTFLDKNIVSIHISDFSLHSIGVILFRQKEETLFLNFISDILPKTSLISLPKSGYEELLRIRAKFDLDFDDSYHYCLCRHFDFTLVTMDQDFKKVPDTEIKFL